MSDERSKTTDVSRRKLLAYLGSASVVISGSALLLSSDEIKSGSPRTGPSPTQSATTATEPGAPDTPTTTQQPSPTPGSQETGTPTPEPLPPEKREAENILEYGARPNPEDPGIAAAKNNLKAIQLAASAAGTGGTIYVPAGTYYFGHDQGTVSRYLEFGNHEPAGISILGDGPTESVLAITQHAPVDSQPNQSFGYWNSDFDHETVEIKQIRLDGNYENIGGNLSKAGGGSWGPQFGGDGEFHLYNAHIRGWHLAGVRGRAVIRSAIHCSFEDNGIKRHNETGGDSISHHMNCAPPKGEECLIKNCYFKDCAGSAVDVKFNDGTIKLYNSYAEGTGANLCKLSAASHLDIRHVYHQGRTESLVKKLDEAEEHDNFYGKNFIQSLGERGEVRVTVNTEHVISRDLNDYAFQARDNFQRGPPSVTWTGDMVAFQNTNRLRNDHVIRERGSGRYIDLDVSRLSIHDSGSMLFGTKDSSGQIAVLNRRGNEGIGECGDITIEEDHEDAEPFRPTVPSKDNVGVDSPARPDFLSPH